MSKTAGHAEKPGNTKETHAAPVAGAPTPGVGAPGGDHKKGKTEAPSKTKGHNPLPGGCFSWGCKVHASRFNFCDEHYDHFKFGLIKKTGEPVPDFEKKIEHYAAYVAKRKTVQKVA